MQSRDPDAYVEAVLRVVESIPPGRVMSYAAVAECVGRELGRGGPRQVGAVMASYGAAVPWWRVVRADGSLPPSHGQEACMHFLQEATPLRRGAGGAARIDMDQASWIPAGHSLPNQDGVGGV